MAIYVNTAYAPELLICRLTDWPSSEEQDRLRGRLIADGFLMSHTSALVDLRNAKELPVDDASLLAGLSPRRNGPHRIAIVVETREQAAFVTALHAVATAPACIAAFLSEREALKWLFPEVGDAFPLSLLS